MQNKKFSIIIPTMLKNTFLLENLIKILNEDDFVDEILVIDNSTKGFKSNFKKVKTIIMHKNLFVNPSWNLGIKNIKNDYFAIFNDDLIIANNFFAKVAPLLKENMGLIGIDKDYIQTLDNVEIETVNDKNTPCLKEAKERNLHWGTIIIGHIDSYFQIPNDMLIWCGDDYLFEMNLKNNRKNYKLSNCLIKHIHGLTSAQDNFFWIKYNDCKIMQKYFSKFKIPKIYSKTKLLKFFVNKCKQK